MEISHILNSLAFEAMPIPIDVISIFAYTLMHDTSGSKEKIMFEVTLSFLADLYMVTTDVASKPQGYSLAF